MQAHSIAKRQKIDSEREAVIEDNDSDTKIKLTFSNIQALQITQNEGIECHESQLE
jgi:hypothetical protein